MEGHIFVGLIEDWIQGLAKRIKGDERPESVSTDAFDAFLQPEDIQRFKSWLSLALRITDTWTDGVSVFPEDVVVRSAVKRSHPKLLKALSMFTDKELLDLFGQERANQIRGVVNESAPQHTSSGTMLIYPSSD